MSCDLTATNERAHAVGKNIPAIIKIPLKHTFQKNFTLS